LSADIDIHHTPLDKRRNICQPNNDIQHLHRRRAIASAIAVAENASDASAAEVVALAGEAGKARDKLNSLNI